MTADFEKLKLDYEQTLETYRQFAEIRFKLLAFVPTLSGAAIALLTKATHLDRWEKVLLAGAGFLVTLGVVLYDQRNTQFYDGAISRAQHLEQELELPKFERDEHVGLFGSRKDQRPRRILGVRAGHDLALSVVYATVLGGWVFAAVLAAPARAWIAAVVATVVAVAFALQLEWHDPAARKLRKRIARPPESAAPTTS